MGLIRPYRRFQNDRCVPDYFRIARNPPFPALARRDSTNINPLGLPSSGLAPTRPQSGGTELQAPLGVHQFNTTLCPAATVAGRMLLPSLTEYVPAGKETGWLTCFDASCVPEASSTA